MRKIASLIVFIAVALALVSCDNPFVEEIVKIEISDSDKVTVLQGQPGEQGEPGSVVTIGENGNWFIDGMDTGEKAGAHDIRMVTFNTDGGSPAIKSHIVVVGGYVIAEPDLMSKSGYEFAGWYYDADFSEEVEFPVTVNDHIEFWAKWIQLPI